MRICSFLPSATEMIAELGFIDSLVGVSEECRWPPEVIGKPIVTAARIDPSKMSSLEIDEAVRASVREGRSRSALPRRCRGRGRLLLPASSASRCRRPAARSPDPSRCRARSGAAGDPAGDSSSSARSRSSVSRSLSPVRLSASLGEIEPRFGAPRPAVRREGIRNDATSGPATVARSSRRPVG
jgi:hypothetical protein